MPSTSTNGASRKNKLPVRVTDSLRERLNKLHVDLIRNQNGEDLAFSKMISELLELALVNDELMKQLFQRHQMPRQKSPRTKVSAGH